MNTRGLICLERYRYFFLERIGQGQYTSVPTFTKLIAYRNTVSVLSYEMTCMDQAFRNDILGLIPYCVD